MPFASTENPAALSQSLAGPNAFSMAGQGMAMGRVRQASKALAIKAQPSSSQVE